MASWKYKELTFIMEIVSTYKIIYEISQNLSDIGFAILGMLLIKQVCFDATKNSKFRKGLIGSGYIQKIKEFVIKQ
jgi:hypothetical protein